MRRRAILIEAANVKRCTYIPGAEADVKNYKRYLMTTSGGAWHESEITVLSKPSSLLLVQHVNNAEALVDYLFVSFSGHGYMRRPQTNSFISPSANDLTMLCLNDSEQVPLSIINPRIRNFVIVDSCRGLEDEAILKACQEEARALYFSEDIARQIFDNAVMRAEIGQSVAFSCGINESAGEDKNRGGYFSAAMMECGLNLSNRASRNTAITVADVFKCAFSRVKTQAATQNPDYSPGRRLCHFPFAVRG